MEPLLRLAHAHVRLLPRVPGVVGLAAAGHESPLHGVDLEFLADRQDGLDPAALRAGHVLGEQQRPPLLRQIGGHGAELLRRIVAVEADHIGLLQLDGADLRPGIGPHARGERLRGIARPRPLEGLGQQLRHAGHLVGRAQRVRIGEVLRLVPHVPGHHARILRERGDHAGGVGLQRAGVGIGESGRAGALHPGRVVHAGRGLALHTGLGVRVPAGVEEHEHGANAVGGGDRQEGVEPLLEPGRVGCPQLILEEDADHAHPQSAGPGELGVDPVGVEGLRLEHLELVPGVGVDEVAAHHPADLLAPLLRALRRPARRRSGGGRTGSTGHRPARAGS
ncbi:hypothetical protein TSST111916_21000 [Tsukamurella strandjordii]